MAFAVSEEEWAEVLERLSQLQRQVEKVGATADQATGAVTLLAASCAYSLACVCQTFGGQDSLHEHLGAVDAFARQLADGGSEMQQVGAGALSIARGLRRDSDAVIARFAGGKTLTDSLIHQASVETHILSRTEALSHAIALILGRLALRGDGAALKRVIDPLSTIGFSTPDGSPGSAERVEGYNRIIGLILGHLQDPEALKP